MLCLNVLEFIEDPGRVLDSMRAALKPGGVLVILVPQNPGLYGTLDQSLGYKRRYSAAEARQLAAEHGFTVETVDNINKAGTFPWWVYSRVVRSRRISKLVLKLFDKTVWLWSRVNGLIPWKGLSLLVIARKTGLIRVRRTPGPHGPSDPFLAQRVRASRNLSRSARGRPRTGGPPYQFVGHCEPKTHHFCWIPYTACEAELLSMV